MEKDAINALHIVDVNNLSYRGLYNRAEYTYGVSIHKGIYQSDKLPMGVVYYIFNHLNRIDEQVFAGVNNYYAFCADSRNIIKKELFPEYKAQRNYDQAKKYHLYEQMEFLKQLLRDNGFPVFEINGYEADDLSYSLWCDYRDYYDFVFFHVNDSDYHFMIDSDKVGIIKPVNGGLCKLINKENFEAETGLAFNLALFQKLINSDTSDNVRGIGMKWSAKLLQLAKEMGSGYANNQLNNPRALRNLVIEAGKQISGFPLEQANRILDILIPTYVRIEDGKEIAKGRLIQPYKYFDRDILRSGSELEKQSLKSYIENFRE